MRKSLQPCTPCRAPEMTPRLVLPLMVCAYAHQIQYSVIGKNCPPGRPESSMCRLFARGSSLRYYFSITTTLSQGALSHTIRRLPPIRCTYRRMFAKVTRKHGAGVRRIGPRRQYFSWFLRYSWHQQQETLTVVRVIVYRRTYGAIPQTTGLAHQHHSGSSGVPCFSCRQQSEDCWQQPSGRLFTIG
ncbi:hypothetical protein CCHOA_06475 [Corynebacterium choanae]|uniref:Uncharacterized protein n=1 Tax=Corynebacterium choanae TaxID=1862358 RepID=A0A3G6JC09_9CORY|nr:hypothetical protein CCHOA_06475 [Corynebacterium choanae]